MPLCKLKLCPVKLSTINMDEVLGVEGKVALMSHIKYIDCYQCGRSGRWDSCVAGTCTPYDTRDSFKACLKWIKTFAENEKDAWQRYEHKRFTDPPQKTTVAWSREFPPHKNRYCKNCDRRSWQVECFEFRCKAETPGLLKTQEGRKTLA